MERSEVRSEDRSNEGRRSKEERRSLETESLERRSEKRLPGERPSAERRSKEGLRSEDCRSEEYRSEDFRSEVDLKGFDRTSGDQKQADGPFHTRRQSDVLKSADPRGDGHWNVARCFRFQDVPPSCHPDRDGWVVIHHETDVDRVNLSRCQSQREGGDRIVSS